MDQRILPSKRHRGLLAPLHYEIWNNLLGFAYLNDKWLAPGVRSCEVDESFKFCMLILSIHNNTRFS